MTNQRKSLKLYVIIIIVLLLVILFYFEWQTSKEKLAPILDTGQQNHPYIQPFLSSEEDVVVIYNRVPKTGSTSFVNVAYDLCKRNHFRVLHINVTGNVHVMSLPNQIKFVRNVTDWDAMKPALYHGHMAFIDFQKFGVARNPLFINLIRKPLDRFVSYYYFLRFGDNFRPYLVRKKAGDKMSFDQCVSLGMPDCKPELMWLQIPFFCGHASSCWQPGSQWALEEAKKNLLRYYLVVGVTEDLANFIRVLEAVLPRLFKGATKHFLSDRSHLRITAQKVAPNHDTVNFIQNTTIWKLENEFYEFALDQFRSTLKKVLDSNQIFFYEKIRPKN